MSNTQDPTKQQISRIMTPRKAVQFLLLGLLWLVCSITVILAGAATSSVFYVGIKILNDDADIKVARLFFKGIKQNFIQGLLMSLISAVTLGGSGALITWAIISGQNLFLILIAAGCAFVFLIFNTFAYPIIGRYENTFANILRNALALIFTYMSDSIRLTLFLIFEIAIDVVLFRLNLIAGFASLLFWPTVIFYTISYHLAVIFYKVEHPKKYDDEETPAPDEQSTKN